MHSRSTPGYTTT
jgi:hypothetical protein